MLNYKYKYNGKEYQDELGLNVYNYGFRNYMPDLGRWFNIDPLAEKYYNNSPYVYVKNSPLTNIDPDGRYLFGLFGSTSSERRMARAEKYAEKTGGTLSVSKSGKPMVTTFTNDANGGVTGTTKTNFGDFSSWKNFKQTLVGMDKAMQGSGGNEYTGKQGMREFGDDLGKSSTYVKVAGAIVTASSVVVGPEAAPVGIAIYEAGSAMDNTATTLKATADFSEGKIAQGTTGIISIGVGKVADGVIDKNVVGAVSQTILKQRADAYIGEAKDGVIDNLNKD